MRHYKENFRALLILETKMDDVTEFPALCVFKFLMLEDYICTVAFFTII
jgi:hypothetical protein